MKLKEGLGDDLVERGSFRAIACALGLIKFETEISLGVFLIIRF